MSLAHRLFGYALFAFALLATALSAHAAPGHYVVVELDEQGRAFPVFHRRVELAERPVAAPAELLRARQHPERLAISGRGWTAVADAPRFLRGEFAANGHDGHDGQIDAHLVRAPQRSFVLRIPDRAGPRLQLEFMGIRSELRLDELAARADRLPMVAGKSAALSSPPPNSGNRVDILVMGDGYTSAEQSKFNTDVEDLRLSMFGMAPYQQYASFVNWTALFTASTQSGADHPPYQAGCSSSSLSCCGDSAMQSDPRAGTFVNTAFDGRFCTSGIHRLVVVNSSKLLAAASAQPDWDEILVLVNDPVYGGSGGSFSVTTTHPSADLIVLHEYGHTFHRLADEYETPYPGYPACSDISGSASCQANVTDQTSPTLIKWKDWLTPGIAIPTPAGTAGVGLFQGARYQSVGMYRPQNTCAMRSLGVPFCAVCAQEYVLRLYRGGFGVPAAGIDLIEPGSESPATAGSIAYTAGTTQNFAATILRPSPDTVTLQWYLDGVAIPGANSASYAFQQASATPATRRLELLAFDNTPLVNANIATSQANIDAMSHWRTWNIAVSAPPASLSVSDASLVEGQGGTRAMAFTISLSQAAAGNVSFDIATRDLRSGGRSASVGSDYLAASRSGVVIPAGQTSASFTVKVLGDQRVEPDEAFGVEIRNVSGAGTGNTSAAGWILNDDAN